jgi:hypothetical protein
LTILANKGDAGEFGSIVSNIRSMIVSNSNFVVKFVRRQTNMIVHTLFKAAISYANHHTFNSLPSCIEHLLINGIN